MNLEQNDYGENLEAHRRFRESGEFYKIPIRELSVGDLVIPTNSLDAMICEVSEIRGDEIEIIIGFDDEEQEVKKILPSDQVRYVEDYANAYLKFLGLDKMVEVVIQGDIMTTRLKPVNRNN